ncbi:MAG TPA: hypothetical protein PK156_43945 [Polyangium sp.]|nr:hypothetical protein [Polyangium sp.]
MATRFTEAEKLVVLHTAETARFVDDVHAYAGLPANAIATRPFDRNRIEEIGVAMENAIQLLGSTTPIAVEVTGGTKPMGSYMQSAAASCGLDTLYLDYDEYDPKHRKPVPSSIYVRLLRTPVVRPVNNALISEVVGRLAIMRQHLQILAQMQGREGVDPNVAITRLEIEIDQLMARLKRTTST